MKCPKCGKISFDYLQNCLNCGQDLQEISARLGSFAKPNTKLMWLSNNSKKDDIGSNTTGPDVEKEKENSTDLSNTDLEEIDLGELEIKAQDNDFQQALDKALKDK
jgi:hypothetical protein